MEHQDLTKLTEKYLIETDDNVIGVSYGYKTINGKITTDMAICFSVKEKLPINQIDPDKLLPSHIEYLGESFITDVNERDIRLCGYDFCFYPEFYSWMYGQPTNAGTFRPIKGGVITNNTTLKGGSSGTFSFLAKDNDDNSLVGVSNAHVFIENPIIATDRSPYYVSNIKNNIISQPNAWGTSSVSIGVAKRYVPLKLYPEINKSDAALTTIDASVVSNSESWKVENLNTITSPMPFATTAEINNILVTDTVLYSAGATTGGKGEQQTKLKAQSVNTSITVGYELDGGYKSIAFSDCITFYASPTSYTSGDRCYDPLLPGDSGSPLIADIDGTKKIIGLVFAGSFSYAAKDPRMPITTPDPISVALEGFACRIDNVAADLNITEWDGTTINFSNKNGILEHIVTGRSGDPYITISGKKYWQAGLI